MKCFCTGLDGRAQWAEASECCMYKLSFEQIYPSYPISRRHSEVSVRQSLLSVSLNLSACLRMVSSDRHVLYFKKSAKRREVLTHKLRAADHQKEYQVCRTLRCNDQETVIFYG